MTKKAANYVVIVAKSDVSGYPKWLFVKNNKNGKWELPVTKLSVLDAHPIIRAVKSSVGIFDDVDNIELSFKLEGDEITAMVYEIIFDFEKSFKKIESQWLNPIDVWGASQIEGSEIDEFTINVIETIIKTYQKMQGKKATKSSPLKFKN